MKPKKLINSALRKLGFELERATTDFTYRPLDELTRTRTIRELAAAYLGWLRAQAIFDVALEYDVAEAIDFFWSEWARTPFGETRGGSRFNNLVFLFLVARSYDPEVIVDSGTYTGASAWAFATACPHARITSFDIDLSNLKFRHPAVTYVESDWCAARIDARPRSLIYFDDHVDQIRRLLEAHDGRFSVGIFDDDFGITSYFRMAPSASVLPKLEFALDKELVEGTVLEWTVGSQRHRFEVDRSYLDRGLSRIRATERLPNTSLITGIHQTPYRIVSLRSAEAGDQCV